MTPRNVVFVTLLLVVMVATRLPAVDCDADGNGIVDAPDAPTAAEEVFGTAAPGWPDCSGDGQVDAEDVARIIIAVHHCTIFPADNPWNIEVSAFPIHSNSDAYIASIGAGDHLHPDFGTVWAGAPNGIPYAEVPADQPLVPVEFVYWDESDPGPYPIPPDAPIEGGPDSDGDRHVLLLDRTSCMLWELYWAWPPGQGENPYDDRWYAGSGAVFDLTSNELRPDGWTSADAAGLPIYPGLVRYEEVMVDGVVDHALRFTASQTQRAYIHPATHAASASTDPDLPPMGLRLRMKSDYDCSALSAEVQVICSALKTYGMFVADNGSDWFVSGAPDPRWDDEALADLHQIPGSAFEAVDTGPIIPY